MKKLKLFSLALMAMFATSLLAADFDITVDQFRTTPISGLVKIDNSNLSLSGGAMQLSSGNQDFVVSTTNSDYKIKQIVFTSDKAIIKYNSEAISNNTFSPETPSTSFTLNLTASGGTAKITKMEVKLTTSTSETLEELRSTGLSDGVYTTGSSVITLSTVGGSHNDEYINISKSKGTRSLTITATGNDLQFVTFYYYDAVFSKTISPSTGTYTPSTYTWIPGLTSTNTVTFTFNTENSEGAKIRKIYVGYTPSCDATIPGEIEKGDLSAGVLTLNATGTPATNNVWYWQTSATGTDKTNNGSSFGVEEPGTYYVRSQYNNACWSDAQSITIAASDFLPAPTVTFSDGAYVKNMSGETAALDLSTLFTSNSDGTVTYSVKTDGGTNATIDGTNFSATAAGTCVVTASQAATASYASATSDANIVVSINPLGAGHVLTWNLIVRESSSNESTLGTATTEIGTDSKASTSSYLTTLTDLTGVGVKRTTDGKSNNTGKIETPASYDADKYVTMTFAVASGYKFTPSAVSIKTVAVSTAKDLKFEFSDASSNYSVTKTNLSTSGTAATNALDFSACDKAFTGTVTIKIYVYGANNAYRLSTPLTVTGTVAAVTPPTAIENTNDEAKAIKRIENGMLIIEKNGIRYNAQGQVIR